MLGKSPVDAQRQAHSFWYHALSRDLIRSGQFDTLVNTFGVGGFSVALDRLEHAIAEGSVYDDLISRSAETDPARMLESLVVADARAAADRLSSMYERTDGGSGYVVVPLSPLSAANPEELLREARRLFESIARPNVMITMPGKPANVTAIEEALFSGVNVLITFIYSTPHYVNAAELYMRAMERRLYAGLPLHDATSAVAYGVGSVDALCDMLMTSNARSSQARGDWSRASANRERMGKVALANARDAYRRFREMFYGERFSRLREAGARVQRLMWMDMQPQNPLYEPTLYLDSLAVPDTISLVNLPTLETVRLRGGIPAGREQAMEALFDAVRGLTDLGLDLEIIGRQLQGDAEEMLEDLYQQTLARIEGKRQLLATGFTRRQRLVLGVYQERVEAAMKRHREAETMPRLARRDHTLWKDSAEHERLIVERLGWLDLPASGRIDREQLRAARDDSKAAGWQHVVLMGMGGSVLAAQVLAETFGPQPDFPQLLVLNSTDPAAVSRVESSIDLERTLFVVASKTGKTIESLALSRYFYGKAYERFGDAAGEHFIAVTDPDSDQESEARTLKFRQVFLNPPDMNGRYAAVSYLSLVPAAMVGVDVEGVLDAAVEMQQACSPSVSVGNNPGLWLGTVLAVLAAQGRDKLTLITSPEIAPLAAWIEQLVAASTGKEGKGIVPVIGETLGTPYQYDDDRLIVYLRLDGSADDLDEGIRRLQQAGHPVISIELRDRRDIGAEFYRWTFATAVAGMVMQINPFEESEVTEGKQNTAAVLEAFATQDALPDETPVLVEEGVALYADASLNSLLEQLQSEHDYQTTPLSGKLAAFLSLARSGDYVCLLAYVPPHPEIVAALEGIRARIRHILKRAVTLGYGPRSLHSSSQLHRGGPNTGVFILFTANSDFDLAIPGMPFGFRALKRAEAIGDLEAMRLRGRRVVRVDLGADIESGLRKVTAALEAAAEKRG